MQFYRLTKRRLIQVQRLASKSLLFLYFNHHRLLNSIKKERLWQALKKPLKNQLFSSLQALGVGVARRRHRIQEIFDQLTFEQVISVSSYNFILEALFYAASC
ncbi:MAG TPA: hypothetical protein VE944_08330 [Nostoc sp.]|uniref:hypothetical protein n=1 Tax=Nostoc sp. TaxID=1180 RepID=UPI002D530F80|nr:hypothetical protein [Nostoc sp.]HYX14361.1 hypothetical protein [Nostoc sp.]